MKKYEKIEKNGQLIAIKLHKKCVFLGKKTPIFAIFCNFLQYLIKIEIPRGTEGIFY